MSVLPSNIVQVTKLIWGAYPRPKEPYSDDHAKLIDMTNDRVLEILLTSGAKYDPITTTNAIFAAMSNPEVPNPKEMEQYWVAVFEALLLATYPDGCVTVDTAMSEMRTRPSWSGWRPYVILGFLKAANWSHSISNTERNVELGRLPNALGLMLADASSDASCYHIRPVTPWILGQFSSALDTYLNINDTRKRWYRCEQLCCGLANIKRIGDPMAKMMDEVIGRLNHKLLREARLKMLTTFYIGDGDARSCVFAKFTPEGTAAPNTA